VFGDCLRCRIRLTVSASLKPRCKRLLQCIKTLADRIFVVFEGVGKFNASADQFRLVQQGRALCACLYELGDIVNHIQQAYGDVYVPDSPLAYLVKR